MSSVELDGDVWTIPGDRYKSKLDHVVPLSAAAKALVSEKPKGVRGNSWFVFTTTFGAKPLKTPCAGGAALKVSGSPSASVAVRVMGSDEFSCTLTV